jgi:hypothetical protein
MSSAHQSLRRADGSSGSRALAQHEIVDLARAAIILFMTVVAALFVPRSLFATTSDATPASVHTSVSATR